MVDKILVFNGITKKQEVVDYTPEQQAERDIKDKAWEDDAPNRKLKQIKKFRLEFLEETDYLALSDNVLSDEMKAFRKSMRDIPQDYSADKYDELLARETDKTKANFGQLTHTVWSKP